MRWDSPAAQRPWEWHQWFAWYPVRIPASRYEAGQWIWRETVWRKVTTLYSATDRSYALSDPRPAEAERERKWQEAMYDAMKTQMGIQNRYGAPPPPIRPVGRAPKKGKAK